jgi:deoxyribonuclease V
MIACVDVDYRDGEAVAACVLLHDWADAVCAGTHVARIAAVEPYQPGQFYRRELPCLLAVLAEVGGPVDVVLVDGYVWLGGDDRPGLGARLYEALGGTVAVVGVAKTQFAGAGGVPVLRGGSRKPLLVTAAGMDPAVAAGQVQAMHGPYRIPDALKKVDQLCRQA